VRNLILITFLALLSSGNLYSAAKESLARSLNDAFSEVYEKVSPSVVVIEAKQPSRNDGSSIFPDGWESFFQLPPGFRGNSPAQGSGVIFRPDGYIITNFHVVARAASDGITVILKDGRRLPAKVIGADDRTDLAVLKVEAENLPAATLGDSDAVRVGQFAFAIGAPMELPYTFTFGLVSATKRTNLTRMTNYENYIQTDAAINPGNSGGPLCNIDGEVIGINTLISGLSRGLGFAIPINMVRDISEQLVAQGRVIRPFLGIGIDGLEENENLRNLFNEVETGVVVQRIFLNTPASTSELRAGDVILRVDDQPVGKAGEVQQAVLARSVGDIISLEIWRKGEIRKILIEAGEQPDANALAGPSLAPPSGASPGIRPGESVAPPPTPKSLGLEVQKLTPGITKSLRLEEGTRGVIVTRIESESAAEVAGLEPGDVITHLNNQPVSSPEEFAAAVAEIDPERGGLVLIIREEQQSFGILKP